ncbi:MAG TPA: alpha/beta hydrolase-fold protein [Pyrinomonadaceae bacterium]|nr:alpha/beta hydrolase-fold protein [Pyrinomonadaceae bacterium]
MLHLAKRLVIVVALVCGSAAAQQPHTLTGDVRLHKDFHSQLLGNNRDLIVYLPPGYDSGSKRRYSVLYFHDGQNLFDGATSFISGQEWRLDETAQGLIAAGKIEPLIIVGLYNTGKDRVEEYTPVQDPKYKVGGKADLYGRMLVEEVKPFIDRTYRTLKDAKHTGLAGSSLGGLVSIYLGLRYPQVFGRVAVVSPSVFWGDKFIVHYVEALRSKPDERIWLDIGTKEGRDDKEALETVANARLLESTLIKKGWKPGKDLKYFEAQGAEHNERAWAARVGPILEFLFPHK